VLQEIHGKVEGEENSEVGSSSKATLYVLMQIVALDIIFSFDSILTAIGLSNQLAIMITCRSNIHGDNDLFLRFYKCFYQ